MIALTIILAAVPAAIAGRHILAFAKSRASRRWPTAPGRIGEVEIRLVNPSCPDDSSWEIALTYSYLVEGVPHSGWRIDHAYFPSEEPHQRRLYEHLRADQEPAVRYNPRVPSESTLGLGFGSGRIGMLVISSVASLLVVIGGFTVGHIIQS